ncbi:MAG: hypothetical protein JXM79_16250 [Sedimentisphaerales bacterium]|nr:hypothetical protein [Sedimentisphaerales bacterium]
MRKAKRLIAIILIFTMTPALASQRLSRVSQAKMALADSIQPAGSGISVKPEQLGPHSAAAVEAHRPTAGQLGPAHFVLVGRCAFLLPVAAPGKITINASWNPTNRSVEARVFCPGTKVPVARTSGKGSLTVTVSWVHTITGPRPQTGDWMVELRPISSLDAMENQSIGPPDGATATEPEREQAAHSSSQSMRVHSKKSGLTQTSRPRQPDKSRIQKEPTPSHLREKPGTAITLTQGTLTASGPGLGGKPLINITARQTELSKVLSNARTELDSIHSWQLQWEEVDIKHVLGEWAVLNTDDLAENIKSLENWMEEVRNKRQEFTTAFENFDQKSNQLFNLLSSVMKSMKEMQGAVTRNLL